MPSGEWAASATGSSARTTASTRARRRAYRQLAEREPDRYVVLDGTLAAEELAERSPPQWERCSDATTRSRHVPEQLEAKRLLDGRARATATRTPSSSTAPPGVGKTDGRVRVRRRPARRRAPGRRTHAPRPPGRRAARRHDPDRRRSASSTTTCTCVRSRPTAACTSCSARTCSTTTRPTRCSRISRSRRSTPRSCSSPTSSARSRRRSARAASSSRSGGCPSAPSATGSASNAPELGEVEATAIARVAGGRLDRARRLIDPEVRERRAAIIAAARGPYLDPDVRAGRRVARAARRGRAARARSAKDGEEAGRGRPRPDADATPSSGSSASSGAPSARRCWRSSRSSRRGTATSSSSRAAPRAPRSTPTGSTTSAPTRLATSVAARAGGGARAAGVAVGRGVQRQHRALARRALRAAPALVRLSSSPVTCMIHSWTIERRWTPRLEATSSARVAVALISRTPGTRRLAARSERGRVIAARPWTGRALDGARRRRTDRIAACSRRSSRGRRVVPARAAGRRSHRLGTGWSRPCRAGDRLRRPP